MHWVVFTSIMATMSLASRITHHARLSSINRTASFVALRIQSFTPTPEYEAPVTDSMPFQPWSKLSRTLVHLEQNRTEQNKRNKGEKQANT